MKGIPERLTAGISTSPMAMIPPVADMVNSQKNDWSRSTSFRRGVPSRVKGMSSSNVMVTTFESTGAHAAAKKRRRELSNAEAIAVSP